nr:MAG TPA: hypothetical protein [Bacteriophage sp.]
MQHRSKPLRRKRSTSSASCPIPSPRASTPTPLILSYPTASSSRQRASLRPPIGRSTCLSKNNIRTLTYGSYSAALNTSYIKAAAQPMQIGVRSMAFAMQQNLSLPHGSLNQRRTQQG